jgi:hypothetical protein
MRKFLISFILRALSGRLAFLGKATILVPLLILSVVVAIIAASALTTNMNLDPLTVSLICRIQEVTNLVFQSDEAYQRFCHEFVIESPLNWDPSTTIVIPNLME